MNTVSRLTETSNVSVETDLNKLVITARVGQFNKLCDSFQDKFDNLTDTCQGVFILR